ERPERHMRARTNLTGADLKGADLTGADLKGADLTGADLNDAILDGARADEQTKWPEGFDPEAHGVDVW
ncbi:MAG TPA: pentapeptide repeat-containing protein, partial [Acidimicrobiia bacterium]|nr:pentapeptide repeat-containing protein [Acidimicrobiia bacterium]